MCNAYLPFSSSEHHYNLIIYMLIVAIATNISRLQAPKNNLKLLNIFTKSRPFRPLMDRLRNGTLLSVKTLNRAFVRQSDKLLAPPVENTDKAVLASALRLEEMRFCQ